MKLNFTKAEYAVLIRSIYLAEWMMTAADAPDSPAHPTYKALFQKIYTAAKEMGCEDLVTFYPAESRFYPSDALDEDATVRERINHYDEDTFWEELLSRLARRDLARKGLGLDGSGTLSDEQIEVLSDLEGQYSLEFQNHGLSRLTIAPEVGQTP